MKMLNWVTVNDMYKQLGTEEKLLSNFSAEFWEDYNTNHAVYDSRFKRMFSSFRFFEQQPIEYREPTTEEIEEVKDSFINAVYEHLFINNKKYSELYRVNVVPDTDYSIVDNYNVVETMERETSKSDSDTYGSHTDTESETVGQKSNSVNETIGAKEDSVTETVGQKSNSVTESIGAKEDSETESVGQKSNSYSESIGGREDTNTTTVGEQSNSATNTIAGFNSSGFEKDKKVEDEIGERTDESTTTIGSQSNSRTESLGSQSNSVTKEYGAQSNTKTETLGSQSNSVTKEYGSQSNSKTETLGSQNNSKSNVYGSRLDTHIGSGTEDYTLTRKGNIGVKTATEIMTEHRDFWDMWEFYSYIFKEICADLLLI